MKNKSFLFVIFTIFLYVWIVKTTELNRIFEVDWKNNRFLKDGEPFRFIAGSFHYFRAHPDSWQRKLRTMRAAGLNAVTTYVEWSLHNPRDGVYVWNGIADIEKFIRLAAEEDLLVILRPGPYICAERDLGGFPYWLVTKYPGIRLRTSDINYLYEIRLWYSQLMPRILPFLYGNGGSIIMVQVENEYGSYYACDRKYRKWLRDETLAHVQNNSVLFTNDGPSQVYCGQIEGVLATLDFGASSNISVNWAKLRRYQPKGPLVNSEYYPGWLTHWTEPMQHVRTEDITDSFIKMLNDGASVNFYMFYGGTNFGFTAGANDGGPGRFQPDITSYDYDAPMNEAGDPTEKYFKLREIIGRYLPLPNIKIPPSVPKRRYGTIALKECCSLLSKEGRKHLSTGIVNSPKPLSFEELNQFSGLVLYETNLPSFGTDPALLRASGLRDRGYVYVDGILVGVLSRQAAIYQLPISASAGKQLQILVENEGRINFGSLDDLKGITTDIVIEETALLNWTMTKFPLDSYDDIENMINSLKAHSLNHNKQNEDSMLLEGPKVYYGSFFINDNAACDTYLDTTGWGKGVAFVNGENLGRYWPVVGPQITMYVPNEVLKIGENIIVLIEYQRATRLNQITLVDKPNFSGPIRFKN